MDISKIRINFDDFNNDKEGVPFCLSRGEFVNLRYKNSILTTLYQLKIARDCDDYFLDGTFKTSPKGYHQMLNFWGFIRKKNVYLPIANVLLSNK